MNKIKIDSLFRQMKNASVLFDVYSGKEMYSSFSDPDINKPDDAVIYMSEYPEDWDSDTLSITTAMLNDAVVSKDGNTITFTEPVSKDSFEIRLYMWERIAVKQDWLKKVRRTNIKKNNS